jgi:hypothetical protein
MKSTPDRNGPCPCGSGKKYKNCCINKHFSVAGKKSKSFIYAFLIVLGVVVAAVAVINKFKNPSVNIPAIPTADSASGQLVPQPPGPVPEGKEWSPEHGHWHDVVAQDNAADSPPQSSAFTPGPPPGPAPEGKEWSSEHGHWHNIPGYIDEKAKSERGSDVSPAPAESEFKEVPAEELEAESGGSE